MHGISGMLWPVSQALLRVVLPAPLLRALIGPAKLIYRSCWLLGATQEGSEGVGSYDGNILLLWAHEEAWGVSLSSSLSMLPEGPSKSTCTSHGAGPQHAQWRLQNIYLPRKLPSWSTYAVDRVLLLLLSNI